MAQPARQFEADPVSESLTEMLLAAEIEAEALREALAIERVARAGAEGALSQARQSLEQAEKTLEAERAARIVAESGRAASDALLEAAARPVPAPIIYKSDAEPVVWAFDFVRDGADQTRRLVATPREKK